MKPSYDVEERRNWNDSSGSPSYALRRHGSRGGMKYIAVYNSEWAAEAAARYLNSLTEDELHIGIGRKSRQIRRAKGLG